MIWKMNKKKTRNPTDEFPVSFFPRKSLLFVSENVIT